MNKGFFNSTNQNMSKQYGITAGAGKLIVFGNLGFYFLAHTVSNSRL